MRFNFNGQRLAVLAALYDYSVPLGEIAARFGTTRETLTRYAHWAGFPPRQTVYYPRLAPGVTLERISAGR